MAAKSQDKAEETQGEPSQVLRPVTFTRPHSHAGREYRQGDTAQVTAREAEKLGRWGVVKD